MLAFGVATSASAGRAKNPETGGTVHHRSTYAAGVPRDPHGRIARDPRARNAFRRTHPCPSTGTTTGGCKGYVIDHVQPLKRGGADSAANMPWQSQSEAKAKDRTE